MTVSLEEFVAITMLIPICEPDILPTPDDKRIVWGVPLCLVGLSGVGKTKRLRQVALGMGVTPHYVYAGTKQPEDFGGVYMPVDGKLRIECVLQAARACSEAGEGLIVIDEVSTASPRTQAALLSAVDERQFGDLVLPHKTRIILAMNPTEYAAGGYAIEAPLANRMMHKSYDPPARGEWTNWLTGQKTAVMSLEHGEDIVCREWANHWPQVVGLAAGFMQRTTNDMLHNQPKPDDKDAGGAWASPRTWYMALRAIATVRCLRNYLIIEGSAQMSEAEISAERDRKVQEISLDMLGCLVGDGPKAAWMAYTSEFDLPSPEYMLESKWVPDTKRLDRTYASLICLTEFIKSRKDDKERAKYGPDALDLLCRVVDHKLADLAVIPMKEFVKAGLRVSHDNKIISAKAGAVLKAFQEQGLDVKGI